MAEDELSAYPLALWHLRRKRNWTRQELASKLGFLNEDSLGRLERGAQEFTREYLDQLVAPMFPPEAVDALLFTDRLLSAAPAEEAASPVALLPEERARVHRTVLTVGWTVAEQVLAELPRQRREEKIAEALQRAEALWAVLQPSTPEDRRKLVETFPQFRCWALVRRVCEASVRAASHRPEGAVELAELALFVAERVPGEDAWRRSLAGFAMGHLGNAYRVGTDFAGAGEAFARAWELWNAGAAYAHELLPEWRLLDLEASLRREQHRFSEALELLGRALAACGDDPAAAARIWLNKEHALTGMGDIEGAVSALQRAAPLVERSGDPHLLFALRFNTADHLTQLGRSSEAVALVAEVREMAIAQRHDNDLELTRVLWLQARVDAGLGRQGEAITGLEQVMGNFTHHDLPYEAALAALDLALLWLARGRTKEVQELALRLGWVFRSKRIDREALLSLALFCEAARQETATAELVQRAIADLKRVKGSAFRPEDNPESRA